MHVSGEGTFSSKIKILAGNSTDSVFEKPSPEESISNFSMQNLTVEGSWGTARREGTGSLISGRNIDNVYINGVRFLNGRFFGININLCTNVVVTNCRFKYICRDMCAVWNTPNTLISNNIFLGNDDDGISLNSAGFEPDNGVVKSRLIVTSNVLEDCGGIRVQSPNTVIIANNILQRNKGNAQIKVGALNSTGFYQANPQTVLIENNIITDILDRFLATEIALSINVRVGLKLETLESTVADEIADPYNFYYTTTGAAGGDSVRTSSGIFVRGNVIKRTLPAVTNYSDWGFGRMFTRFSTDTFAPDGFVDPEIPESAMSARCVEIEGPLKDATFQDNSFFHNSAQIVDFQVSDGGTISDNYWNNVRFIGNTFSNCTGRALDFTDSENTSQNVLVKGNYFDLDPLQVGGSRSTNGTWGSAVNCVGVYAFDVSGVQIVDNIFKNCGSPYIQGSASASIYKKNNRFVGEPAANVSAGTHSTSNKGLGLFPSEVLECPSQLIYEDSDPASATYGQLLEQPARRVSGTTPPTLGFYFEGQLVFTNAGSLQTGFKEFAYRRLTTGTGNVSGTDWEQLEARIG